MRKSTVFEFIPSDHRRLRLLFLSLILIAFLVPVPAAVGEEPRCAALDLFLRKDDKDNAQVTQRVKAFAEKNGHIQLFIHMIEDSEKNASRFQQILDYFHLKTAKTPALYGCNYLLRDLKPDESTDERIQSLLTVSIFTRPGCEKCAAAKQFLPALKQRYPVFLFKEYDIVNNQEALERVQKLSQRYGKQAVSVPVFHLCNKLQVGWISEQFTGEKLEKTMQFWTKLCPQQKPKAKPKDNDQSSRSTDPRPASSISQRNVIRTGFPPASVLFAFHAMNFAADDTADSPPPPALPADDALPPIPGGDASPPPLPFEQPALATEDTLPPPDSQPDEIIEVPLLGELNKSRLGMPAFTFLIGLVDGFNPCAMWVLLFLLSLLVNLQNRAKIIAVAGTFVLISGLAYLAFMAAWLNVFLLIGYLPTVQFLLGLFAVLIGMIHVKDFFAFKKGISLSIPEWAKPGLYARVRRIVNAENLTGAIIGAAILAVLVNIIELLCTAGLPALYTEILTMQNYPAWKSYAYLGLYIVAYMLDDAIMVTIVVVTLGRHKLQETQGRYLKLFSGMVILLLGLVLIVKPSLLF